jgi:hypothetical protein
MFCSFGAAWSQRMEANLATLRNRKVRMPESIEILTARSGMPTLRIDGNYVHSAYDPEKESDKWARTLVDREDLKESLFVILGCGLGYPVRSLLDHGAERIIVYEPDGRLNKLRQKIAGDLDDLEQVVFTTDAEMLRDVFREKFPSAKGTRISILPAFEKIYSELIDDVKDQLNGYVNEFRVSRYTFIHSSRSWMRLTVQNLPAMIEHPAVGILANKGNGWPVVVISAGPSLDRNIDQLTKVQENFLVLCPSQSLKAAVAAGVTPDLVMVADSTNLSYHFKGCGPGSFGNLLVAAKCHPEVVCLPARRKLFYFLRPNPMAEEFYRLRGDDNAELPTGASVSNIAMHLAVYMNADPIIFMGQDLAFAGKKMYASNAADGGGELDFDGNDKVSLRGLKTKEAIADDWNREELSKTLSAYRQVHWVRGLNGERLQTTVDMHSMLAKFERDASNLAGQKKLINATEGGAYIRGMEHLTFAQVVERYRSDTPVDLEKRIGQIAVIERQAKQRAMKRLRKMWLHLGEMKKTAQRAMELSNRVKNSSCKDLSLLKSLSGSEARLDRLLGKVPAVNAMVQQAMVNFRLLGDPDDDDLEMNIKRSRILFEAVYQGSQELRQELSVAIEKGAT